MNAKQDSQAEDQPEEIDVSERGGQTRGIGLARFFLVFLSADGTSQVGVWKRKKKALAITQRERKHEGPRK